MNEPTMTQVELRKIDLELKSLQCRMEGPCRQLYQACTQAAVHGNFPLYATMSNDIRRIMGEIEQLLSRKGKLTAALQQEEKENEQ